MPTAETARYAAAVAAIDAANALDPHRIVVGGEERPKELAHADLVERWVRLLDPDATELQLLAARAHHLRRWVVPRSDYPEGRAGYLRWRTDHKRRQADEVAAIVEKRNLATDRAVQVHEDALCLAFLELQLDPVAEQLGDDRTVEVLRKTIRKMSRRAIEVAGSLPLSPVGARLLAAAVEPA